MGLVAVGADSCESGKGRDASTVEFTVRGHAQNTVDITYGNESFTYHGPSEPDMHRSLKVDKYAFYYRVAVQLHGEGSVTCGVQIGDAVSVGHAIRRYCSAQLNGNILGGWDERPSH
jgi:hypothetical protein